jgi:hypothetical protein
MRLGNPLQDLVLGDWGDSLLPDFVLAFTLFTAVIYAVLGKRFDRQRPAIAVSVALGLALSVGLIWWEKGEGLSITNLGPLAVGFAIVILAVVMYQAIRQVGGNWAGSGIALGVCLLVAWATGLRWPAAESILQMVTTVALVVGLMALLVHRESHSAIFSPRVVELPAVRQDRRAFQESHVLSELLGRRMQDLEKKVDHLHEHPEDAGDIMLQIKRMLPAEGWLTERLARLREKAYRVKEGHVARIETIQHLVRDLPPAAKRKAAEELAACYKELRFDVRLERLDGAVAVCERRIRDLTQQAQVHLAAHDYRALHDDLEAATKLQKHNSRLFKIINRTEARLATAAKQIARKSAAVMNG